MSDAERFDCPEAFCIQAFRPQEMAAHLRWDHGYSEFKAEKRVEEATGVSLSDNNRDGDSA
jgi:hypothetical protein